MHWKTCDVTATLTVANELNAIPSPTDDENALLTAVAARIKECNLPVARLGDCRHAEQQQVYIGPPNASLVVVVHGDRTVENADPLVPDEQGIVRGKLDNTISLAAVIVALERQGLPSDCAVLVTTAEESKKPKRGGRGFVDYLETLAGDSPSTLRDALRKRNFLCLDVRPLDKNDVFDGRGNLVELGDGLIVRLAETKSELQATKTIVRLLRQMARQVEGELFDFSGGGRTELGAGWQLYLAAQHIPAEDYHVGWLQMPVREIHQVVERGHIDDVRRLQATLEQLLSSPVLLS